MAGRLRRTIHDNLDPLVDTLSNVVGILVIVVALTQIQLGDALSRVVELDRKRGNQERELARLPNEAKQLAHRRERLLRRTDAGVEETIRIGQEALARFAKLPLTSESEASESLTELQRRVGASREKLAGAATGLDQRVQLQQRLRTVPKEMVARLPDPQVLQGQESWVLVRYGRVTLTERTELLETGSRAIGLILADGVERRIRGDEFDSAARYLRKRDIGDENFRWRLLTEPEIRVQLEWRSPQAGLDPFSLQQGGALRAWLANRAPEQDFIKFHVWGDSFEAYLAAREAVEAAGYRAGWIGHEIDDEFDLALRFGPPEPTSGPIEVD
ncbi:MAG: hypothetical protein VCB25_09075 [Myxococcota bacterium]